MSLALGHHDLFHKWCEDESTQIWIDEITIISNAKKQWLMSIHRLIVKLTLIVCQGNDCNRPNSNPSCVNAEYHRVYLKCWIILAFLTLNGTYVVMTFGLNTLKKFSPKFGEEALVTDTISWILDLDACCSVSAVVYLTGCSAVV